MALRLQTGKRQNRHANRNGRVPEIRLRQDGDAVIMSVALLTP
jgi:hypothetical protein